MGKLREYFLVDRTYQFDEDNVPNGAVLVEPKAQPTKAFKPINKSVIPPNK